MLREGKKEESIELLKKASGQNHTAAIFQLAGEYLKNPGDVKDQKKAFQLMQQLAEAGEAKAQMQIGLMYIFANGTETNFEEGYFWLREAALSGFSPAQNSLSTLLMQGIGKDPNLPLSYAWSSIASGNMLEESEQQAQIKKKLKPNELQLAHNLVEEIKELIQGISAR
jgi:TPR repeat protein